MIAASPYRYLIGYREAACDPATGDEAVDALAGQLAAIDPQTAPPDGTLLDVVRTHLELRAVNEIHPDPVAWADYGYRTAQALHGTHHDVTHAMAIRLADVHHQHGELSTSLHLRQLIIEQATPGTPARALQQMAMASTLHTLGSCAQAQRQADTALTAWQPADDRERQAIGSGLLLQQLQLVDDCGDVDRARSLLAAHRGLLPPPGHTSQAAHVLVVSTQFGDPNRVAAHRRVCGGQRSHAHRHDAGGHPVTAVRDLVLEALGYTQGAALPGLQQLFEQHGLTGVTPPRTERNA